MSNPKTDVESPPKGKDIAKGSSIMPQFRQEEQAKMPLEERTFGTVYKPRASVFWGKKNEVTLMGKIVIKFLSTTRILITVKEKIFGQMENVDVDITDRIPESARQQMELFTSAEEVPSFISAIADQIFKETKTSSPKTKEQTP